MAYVNRTKQINDLHDNPPPPPEKSWIFRTCGPEGCKSFDVKESELTEKNKAELVERVLWSYDYLPQELQDRIKTYINNK